MSAINCLKLMPSLTHYIQIPFISQLASLLTWLLLVVSPAVIATPNLAVQSKETINFHRINVDDGLSQSYVYQTLQDHMGFIWIATQDGLNRYDGKQFVIFRADPNDKSAIKSNDVRVLLEDSQQRLWIGTQGKGLSLYDSATQSFSQFSLTQPNEPATGNIVVDILEANSQVFWIGTRAGLVKFNPQNGEAIRFKIKEKPNSALANRVRDILALNQRYLLLATGHGLMLFDTQTDQYQPFVTQSNQLYGANFSYLLKDHNNSVWAASLDGGLYRFNDKEIDKKLAQLQPKESAQTDKNIQQNSLNNQTKLEYESFKLNNKEDWGPINSLYLDNKYTLWIGTSLGGLFYFDSHAEQFFNYRKVVGDTTSISHNSVLSIYQDNRGLFWIGTWSGGVNTFNLDNQSFRNFAAIPFNSNSLSGDNIWDLMRAKDGTYWFGSDVGGLTRFNPQTETFQHYSANKHDPSSIAGRRVWALAERDDGLIWVGNYYQGLNLFDPSTGKVIKQYNKRNRSSGQENPHSVINMLQTKNGDWWFATRLQGLARLKKNASTFQFYRPQQGEPNSLQGVKVFALFEDSNGQFWVGTENGGLSRYRPETDDFKHYQSEPNNPQSLLSNEVLAIGEDSNNNLLVGGPLGLSRMEKDGVFQHITIKDGLANNTINGLLTDCKRDIWAATNNALSRIKPNGTIINYSKRDGLLFSEFNTTAYQYGHECELLFGGADGAISFIPKDETIAQPVNLVLTNILKYYKAIEINQPIAQLTDLSLSYKDKVVSFQFALTDYNNPDAHQYAYRLKENSEQGDWIMLGKQNQVNLTNLSPGEHLLELKAQSEKGVWSNPLLLNISVSTPWWISWWAYLIYSLLFLLIVGVYLYLQSQKLKAQQTLARKEREVSVKLRKLDKLKDEFLANTTHELRTPLNAILGLSELALKDPKLTYNQGDDLKSYLKLISDSGKHLLALVSDILDYSALNEKKLKLSIENVDLATLLNSLILEMNLLNKNSKVSITAQIESPPWVKADPRRLYQIILNLLSNALKFTEQGEVTVQVTKHLANVVIKVTDTGIGMSKSELKNIFNRFEQVDGSAKRRYGGTGLGLSITKELVELHQGSIKVESKLGEGSIFTLTLPASTPQQ
ncbi:ligand-binding sensor domain-containing protein [Aliikangiella sp. IMCC44653]